MRLTYFAHHYCATINVNWFNSFNIDLSLIIWFQIFSRNYTLLSNLRNTEIKQDFAPLIYLSEKILKPILNINNLQTTNKINYVADSNFRIKEINKKNNLVFLLPKIEVKTIFDTANKNHTLPPKSTFILPKLRTGLLIMELKWLKKK